MRPICSLSASFDKLRCFAGELPLPVVLLEVLELQMHKVTKGHGIMSDAARLIILTSQFVVDMQSFDSVHTSLIHRLVYQTVKGFVTT